MEKIQLSPASRDYVFTLEHPNCIYNNVLGLTKYLDARQDLEKHTNVMAEYDLDYVLPSARYAQIIDLELEDQGYQWRIHSCHALCGKECIRIILRQASLIDLTSDMVTINAYERRLYPIMRKYAEQFCDGGPVIGSSNVAVFRLDKGPGFYYLFTRVFDMWEYSDAHPDIGWRSIEEAEVDRG